MARLAGHLRADAGRVPIVPVTDNFQECAPSIEEPSVVRLSHHATSFRNAHLPRKEQDYTDTSLLKDWCFVIFNGYLSFWVFGLHASLSLFSSVQCIREQS